MRPHRTAPTVEHIGRAASRLGGDDGAALLEFAIIVPLFVTLLFGIYEVSLGYHAKTELTAAVREGARALALRQTSPPVETVVRTAAPGLESAKVVVSVDRTCPTDAATGDSAKVTATYKLPYSIPLVAEGTWDISATGVMRCGL